MNRSSLFVVVRLGEVLQAPCRADYFVLTRIHGQVNSGYPKKTRATENDGERHARRRALTPAGTDAPR